jgi:hypothetical protein
VFLLGIISNFAEGFVPTPAGVLQAGNLNELIDVPFHFACGFPSVKITAQNTYQNGNFRYIHNHFNKILAKLFSSR